MANQKMALSPTGAVCIVTLAHHFIAVHLHMRSRTGLTLSTLRGAEDTGADVHVHRCPQMATR
eukprot:1143010-Pelagomonas_calceolata.AAC.3